MTQQRDTCRYDDGRTGVHETASYDFSVIEAATGTVLAQFTVHSTGAGECPLVVLVPEREGEPGGKVVSGEYEPDVSELLDELRSHVEGPAS